MKSDKTEGKLWVVKQRPFRNLVNLWIDRQCWRTRGSMTLVQGCQKVVWPNAQTKSLQQNSTQYDHNYFNNLPYILLMFVIKYISPAIPKFTGSIFLCFLVHEAPRTYSSNPVCVYSAELTLPRNNYTPLRCYIRLLNNAYQEAVNKILVKLSLWQTLN